MSAASREGITAIIAAVVIIAAPIAQAWEGFVPKVKDDPAGIPTYCYGETENVDPMRVYSKTECGVLLRKRLARDYAPKIAQCLPQVAVMERVHVYAALLDAAYNAGPVAVCNSRMARAIRAGQWKRACQLFGGWYVTAKNRKTGKRVKLKGLVNRRQDEMRVCLKGM